MSFFLNFLKKYNFLFLFLILESLSFFFIFKYNLFKNSILNQLVINLNGCCSVYINKFTSYLNLSKQNNILIEENNKLKTMLYGSSNVDSIHIKKILDTIKGYKKYKFISAKILNNQLIHKDNFYFINRGKLHHVSIDMGVIANEGVAGQIFEVFNNYSRVMSVLNSNIRINARLKNAYYFGFLLWTGDDTRLMHIYDIPQYVNINIGDTLVTANSIIFPEGIPIGKIAGKNIERTTGNWDVSVELFQKIPELNQLNIVKKMAIDHLKIRDDK